jgi:hypothetical protein
MKATSNPYVFLGKDGKLYTLLASVEREAPCGRVEEVAYVFFKYEQTT